jgi:Fic family protein
MFPPYQPKFERSSRFVRLLTLAAEIRAWIRQQSVDVSWIAEIQRDTTARLAHYSTRIEGNPLTLPEVRALADGKDLQIEARVKREVLNYLSTLRWIWQKSPRRDLSEKDLLKMHRLLTAGILPVTEAGAYKKSANAVFRGREVIYRPPPPEAAPILTKGLLGWMGSSQVRNEHAILVAAIAHHRLVSIHPVMDGNGKLARALESWTLYRKGFDTHHLFALDEFFESDRPRYYWQIQKVRKEAEDLTSWVEYVAEGVVETLRKTQRRIQALQAGTPAKRIVLNRLQEQMLRLMGSSPVMTGADMAKALRVSRSYFSKSMIPLVTAGLAIKTGSTKSAKYQLPSVRKNPSKPTLS